MERISKAFELIIRNLGLEKALTVENLRKNWGAVLGDTIAVHTAPAFLKERQLLISVDSPEWLHELQYHKPLILSKLRSYDITSVRFKIGKIRRHPAPPSGRNTGNAVSDQVKDFAVGTSEKIKDAHLRDQIRKTIERSLSCDT